NQTHPIRGGCGDEGDDMVVRGDDVGGGGCSDEVMPWWRGDDVVGVKWRLWWWRGGDDVDQVGVVALFVSLCRRSLHEDSSNVQHHIEHIGSVRLTMNDLSSNDVQKGIVDIMYAYLMNQHDEMMSPLCLVLLVLELELDMLDQVLFDRSKELCFVVDVG
nr:hypothetical protein [Tanacetum cinerariifolium]